MIAIDLNLALKRMARVLLEWSFRPQSGSSRFSHQEFQFVFSDILSILVLSLRLRSHGHKTAAVVPELTDMKKDESRSYLCTRGI